MNRLFLWIWKKLVKARYWLRCQVRPIVYLLITIGIAAYLILLLKVWVIMVLAGVMGFFFLAYYRLAPQNRWFTFVNEGTAKIVMRGKRFHKCLLQWKGWTLDKQGNVIPEGVWTKDGRPLTEKKGKLFKTVTKTEKKPGKKIERERATGYEEVDRQEATPPRWEPWHPLGGFRWYSLIHPVDDIHTYYFAWTNVTEGGEIQHHPTDDEIKEAIEEGREYPDKVKLDYILVKDDVYFATVESAEDKALVPLNVEVLSTMRVVNPRKALFVPENWLEATINRTKPAVRDAMTRNIFDVSIVEKEAVGPFVMDTMEERGIMDEFRDIWGTWLRHLDVIRIDPTDEKYREVILKKRSAQYEREAIKVEADAEKQRLIRIAQGEKERIRTIYGQIREFGDLGRLIRSLEATEKSPLAASLTVQAVPGLPEVLRGVFGQVPEAISREEVKAIRKLLEEVRDRLSKEEEGK